MALEAHEISGNYFDKINPQKPEEEAMDRYNNELGIAIGELRGLGTK